MKKRSEVAGAPGGGVVVPLDLWPVPPELVDISVGGAELLAEDDGKDDFVVSRLIEREDLVLISGKEKDSCKTMLAVHLAISRITGRPWLGFEVERAKSGKVLFISCETSARQIARRLRAICAGLGVDVAHVASNLLVVDRPISFIPRAAREQAADKAHLAAVVSSTKIPDEGRRRSLREGAPAIAEREADALGQRLGALRAIEDAPEGTWSMILVDTLRETLVGDENSSEDTARYIQAARELARSAGCPAIIIHHSGKGKDASDARSARGSTQLTAGPDVLVSIDTTGQWPTTNFKLRNHAAPAPLGYALVPGADGSIRIETRAASGGGQVDDGEVLALLLEHAPDALTLSKVRTLLSERRGGKARSKLAPGPTEEALARLVASKQAAKALIEASGGRTFAGWRAGCDTRPDRAKKIATAGASGTGFGGLDNPEDV